MMGEIYICRHGETDWTISKQHTGKTDKSLTENGKAQAARLREKIRGVEFEAVFSSPRRRALQTCEGMNPIIDPDLAEWDYGDYEGLTSKEIQLANPGWSIFKNGAPNGESPLEIGKRADRFLERAKFFKGKIIIFSHGHFLRVLTARFLELKPEMGKLFFLSVATLGILGAEKGEPVIILWNDPSGQIG